MSRFLINGDQATPQPHGLLHPPRPTIGVRPDGRPVLAGRESLLASWAIMDYADLAKLFSFFNAHAPTVTVTYDDPVTGDCVTKTVEMEWPLHGRQDGMHHYDVQVAFTGVR